MACKLNTDFFKKSISDTVFKPSYDGNLLYSLTKSTQCMTCTEGQGQRGGKDPLYGYQKKGDHFYRNCQNKLSRQQERYWIIRRTVSDWPSLVSRSRNRRCMWSNYEILIIGCKTPYMFYSVITDVQCCEMAFQTNLISSTLFQWPCVIVKVIKHK